MSAAVSTVSAGNAVSAAAMLALAEPVARAASDVNACSVYVSDLCGSRGADLLVRVQLHVRQPREVLLLAERLGLTVTAGPPSLLVYAGEWPEQRCAVEVFCGAPSPEPAPRESQARGAEAPQRAMGARANGRPGE
jgi:hypothetical protein